MNAISSHRPFGESSQIDWNQCQAYLSWEPVFSSITYFGEPESWLNKRGDTTFIPCEGKPSIKNLALYASTLPGWSAIINADIQLDTRAVDLPVNLANMKADCAYSFRYPMNGHKPIDMGLDCFLATQKIWSKVATVIPPEFKIGKIQWDTWLVSYFCNQHRCVDFTPSKLVFHPKHEERNDQSFKANPQDWYLNNVKLSGLKLNS